MPQLANRYEVLETLGEGGMGQVLKVRDLATDRLVALKLLRPGVGTVQHLQQEFWTMTRLRHPRTVEVFDYGTLPDQTPYFTMELVEGKALADLPAMPAEPLTVAIAQICDALAYIHAQGLVHGDLKPANIKLTPAGEIKLIDYGLMRRSGQAADSIRGTPHYLAPEVIRGGPIDRRADLYSLGALAYHLLTGRPPFDGPTLVEILKQHLDKEPAPPGALAPCPVELEGVLLRLLAKDPLSRFQSAGEVTMALGRESPAQTPGHSLLAPVFVGRSSELDALATEFGRQQSTAVLVAGEPGIGKSRILGEFRVKVQLAEVPSAIAICHEQTELPYDPWISLLRQLLPQAQLAAPRLVEAHAPILAAILPELATAAALSPGTQGPGEAGNKGHPDRSEGEPTGGSGRAIVKLGPREDALRLAAAVSEILYAIADARALVLFFEDLHWLDEASGELLGYLRRGAVDHPLMIVGTSRRADLATFADARLLLLGPLPGEDIAVMIASILGGGYVPMPFVETVSRLGGGNPLQVEGLLRHMADTGVLQPEGDRWIPAGEPDPSSLPSALQDLVAARLDRVPAGARDLASILAVAGRQAPIDLLAEVWQQDAEALFKALAELQAEGLVTGVGGEFDFAQPTTRQIVYEGLSGSGRKELHGRLAQILENRLAAADPDRALVLAHHHLASAAPESALPFALPALERAFELHAHGQVQHIAAATLALPVAGTARFRADASRTSGPLPMAPTDARSRARTLLLLGDAQRLLGETQQALAAFDEAAEIAGQYDLSAQAARAHVGAGRSLQIRGELTAAASRIRQGLDLAGDDAQLTCRALCQLGRIAYFASDLETATGHYQRALAVAREHGLVAATAEALSFIGFAFVTGHPDRIEEGLALLRESLALRAEIGDRLGLLDTQMMLGNSFLALGWYPDAAECFTQAQRLAYLAGHKDEEVFTYLNLAIVALERGDFAACDEHARLGEQGSAITHDRYTSAIARILRAMAHLYRGELTDALAMVKDAREQASQIEHRYLSTVLGTYEAEFWLALWQLTDARQSAAAALAEAEKTGSGDLVGPLLILVGTLGALAGDRAAAKEHLERAHQAATSAHAKGLLAKTERGLAIYEAADHRPEAARDHALVGLVLAREIGARYLEGELDLLLGDACNAMARPAEAIEAFREALALGTEMATPELVARAHLGLAQADPPQQAASARLAREQLLRLAGDLPAPLGAAYRERWNQDLGPDTGAATRPTTGGPETEDLRRLQHEKALLQVSARRLQQLVDFSLDVGQIHDLGVLLDQALDLVIEAAGAERGFLLLFEGGVLSCQAYRNLDPKTTFDFHISRSIAQEVLDTARPLCLVDALNDDRFKNQESILALRLRTVICVPLKIRDVVVGVIYVDRQSINAEFTGSDLDFVLSLAALTSNAIENANLVAEWQDEHDKLSRLDRLAREIGVPVDAEEILVVALGAALDLARADRAVLLFWENERLDPRVALDRDGPMVASPEISMSTCLSAVETGQPVCITDPQQDPDLDADPAGPSATSHAPPPAVLAGARTTRIAMPLLSHGTLQGVLYVEAPSPPLVFTSRDVEILESVAAHAAWGIENARILGQLARRTSELERTMRLYEEASLRAATDVLTGLSNRRAFQDELDREMVTARRRHRDLAVLLIDIDHFRSFNETYGHHVGDAVLVAIGQVLLKLIRASDRVARYGPEEFAVVLPETDLAGARIVAERVRQAVAELQFTESVRPVTVSIGVANLEAQDERFAELLERADQALFEAKNRGRNCVQEPSQAPD